MDDDLNEAKQLADQVEQLLDLYESRTIILNNTDDMGEWMTSTDELLHELVKTVGRLAVIAAAKP